MVNDDTTLSTLRMIATICDDKDIAIIEAHYLNGISDRILTEQKEKMSPLRRCFHEIIASLYPYLVEE